MSTSLSHRPTAALFQAALHAVRQHPYPRHAQRAAERFIETLQERHRLRLPRSLAQGLLGSLFEGALDRCVGDLTFAARQISTDLTVLHLWHSAARAPAPTEMPLAA